MGTTAADHLREKAHLALLEHSHNRDRDLPRVISNPYVLAVVCSFFAVLITQLVNRMGNVSTVLLYFAAIIVCSSLAGFRSGLLAFAISLVAAFRDIMANPDRQDTQDIIRYMLSIIIAASLCWLLGHRHQVLGQLQAAKLAAEASTRAKSEFLANISHEIRTPLNGIMGMTDLALEGELSGEGREHLSTVRSCAESLLTIVENILDFSRIENHLFELDLKVLNLPDEVFQAAKVVTVAAKLKGLEVNASCSADIPATLVGDPKRLQQILINLLANAIEFTRDGEIALRVWLEKQLADGVVLHFSVRDTGCGVALDKQREIFEAFSQGDNSTTRQHGGIGLGLAVCAKLVRLMGGQIWVESRVGQGSTFHFTATFQESPSARTN